MSFNKELIDKYAPGAECVEAMKVWKIPEGKEYKFAEIAESGEYFGQIKKDGYWYQFEKTDEGNCYLFSRTISTSTGILTEKSANVPHIMEALSCIPNGTILIGEIYYPQKTSKSVTRIMGCLPEKAVQRQEEEGYIHFYLHDLIKYNKESYISKGALERYNKLKELRDECNLSQYNFLEFADIFVENLQEKVNEVLAQGEEGMVFKKIDSPYSPGKRPAWHNLKIKKVDYVDVICIGFCDPTPLYTGKEIENWLYWYNLAEDQNYPIGNYYKESLNNDAIMPVTKGFYLGWKTAMKIGAYDENNELKEIGTVASGLTDELRQDFAEHPEKYLNKVCKIQCMQKDNNEKTLRHPFLREFREDKSAIDCRLEDIFN